MRTPSVVVACSTFQSSQRPSSSASVRSTKRSEYCINSGSQETSTASMSDRPEPAARRVLRLSRASFVVAAFFCSTVMPGLSSMYSVMRSSYPNSLKVATVSVISPSPPSPLSPLSPLPPLLKPAATRATAAIPALAAIHDLVMRTLCSLSRGTASAPSRWFATGSSSRPFPMWDRSHRGDREGGTGLSGNREIVGERACARQAPLPNCDPSDTTGRSAPLDTLRARSPRPRAPRPHTSPLPPPA